MDIKRILEDALTKAGVPKLMIKMSRTISHEINFELQCSLNQAIKAFYDAATAKPKHIEVIESNDIFSSPFFLAILGRVAEWDITMARVTFTPIGASNVNVHIFGSAKEGLISQKYAEKSISMLESDIKQNVRQSGNKNANDTQQIDLQQFRDIKQRAASKNQVFLKKQSLFGNGYICRDVADNILYTIKTMTPTSSQEKIALICDADGNEAASIGMRMLSDALLEYQFMGIENHAGCGVTFARLDNNSEMPNVIECYKIVGVPWHFKSKFRSIGEFNSEKKFFGLLQEHDYEIVQDDSMVMHLVESVGVCEINITDSDNLLLCLCIVMAMEVNRS